MSVLPIVICPDPRLKTVSKPVEKVDASVRKLMDEMLETMYAQNGIGLAAIQVGVAKRILIMDLGRGSSRYPDSEKGKPNPLFLVNPEIIWASEEQSPYDEGCLSFPGQYAEVWRPAQVKVKYLDYNGKEQILEADGLLATCVQHEMDHLNGITFVDYLSAVKRDMIVRKVKKAQRQKE